MHPLEKHCDKMNATEAGTLYLVATPIGNLGDITLRALEVLRSVDLIAAEDTRHTRKLLSYYDLRKRLISYHSHNAKQRSPELLGRLQRGENIALVTDSGTPGISDPGILIVAQALNAALPIVVLPGPAAFLAGLTASGLPPYPFAFLGFPPVRAGLRERFFARYADLPMTRVLYEAPQRLLKTLADLLRHWGNRKMAVARELTKMYEEVFRGSIEEALDHYRTGVRGELTLVVAGASASQPETAEDSPWRQELLEVLQEPHCTVKAATDRIVNRYKISRRTVYQAALQLKDGGDTETPPRLTSH
jgi:16S rRNA (cytidine1402-2'-O)-methyltransferase